MANYKVIHAPGDYSQESDVANVIRYVTRKDKTPRGGIFGGAVSPESAIEAMNCVTDAYENETGPRLRHSELSFHELDDISFLESIDIAQEAIEYYSDEYQILAAIHEDTTHYHIHFAMNTTSYIDGHKYCGTRQDYYGFLSHLNGILAHYNVTVCPVR